jgi:hypothetical protein
MLLNGVNSSPYYELDSILKHPDIALFLCLSLNISEFLNL